MILVAGGTGRLGAQVVGELLAAGHRVRVLARGVRPRPPEAAGAELVLGSVTDAAAVERAVGGADVVVSAVTGFPFAAPERVDASGNRLLIQAASHERADVVLLSVAGAAPDSAMALFRAKYDAEQALARSGVRATIVRPEAFADLWIDLLTTTAGRAHRPLVFGPGQNPTGWVAIRDVAALVGRAVTDDTLRGGCFTISGPEQLSVTELAQRVMDARGWPGTPRHVPDAVLRLVAHLPGRAGRQAEAALAMEHLLPVVDDARSVVPDLPCTPVAELLSAPRV